MIHGETAAEPTLTHSAATIILSRGHRTNHDSATISISTSISITVRNVAMDKGGMEGIEGIEDILNTSAMSSLR